MYRQLTCLLCLIMPSALWAQATEKNVLGSQGKAAALVDYHINNSIAFASYHFVTQSYASNSSSKVFNNFLYGHEFQLGYRKITKKYVLGTDLKYLIQLKSTNTTEWNGNIGKVFSVYNGSLATWTGIKMQFFQQDDNPFTEQPQVNSLMMGSVYQNQFFIQKKKIEWLLSGQFQWNASNGDVYSHRYIDETKWGMALRGHLYKNFLLEFSYMRYAQLFKRFLTVPSTSYNSIRNEWEIGFRWMLNSDNNQNTRLL